MRIPELFSAVKGGILSFSRSLARSLAPTIRVNVLGPGWIDTSFGQGAPDRFRARVAEQIPWAGGARRRMWPAPRCTWRRTRRDT